MTRPNPILSPRPLRTLTLAALLACGSSAALAGDWPTFKPGNWQYDHTIEKKGVTPQTFSTSRCIDPTADMTAQRESLKRAGCEIKPPTQSGTTYRYSTACQGKGKTTASQSVLEATSAEAFKLTTDTATNKSRFREVLTAKRVGDCPQ